jgi:hypothetical protein
MAQVDSGPESRGTSESLVPAFARQAGIILDEKHAAEVPNAATAERHLASWKELMPLVASAYRPSGNLSARALFVLPVAAVLGTPFGVFAGWLFAVVGYHFLGYPNLGKGVPLRKGGDDGWVELAIGCACCLAVLPITAIVAGWAASLLSRPAKNRNPRAARWCAGGAGALATLAADVLFLLYGKGPLDQLLWGPSVYLAAAYVVAALLGAPLGVWVAARIGGWRVEQLKFCEGCAVYMKSAELPGLCLGGLRTMARALAERNLTVAAALLEDPTGEDGKPVLYTCPTCGRGYVELTAHYAVSWHDPGDLMTEAKTKKKMESWLAASVEVTPAEARRFQPFAGRAGTAVPGSSRREAATGA